MRGNILKVSVVVLLLAFSLLCCSCSRIKCEQEKISCKWDCPETIGLKQACEQKCNVMYDICRKK